ncbi:LuxR C-terminal-related transcriptional regulator [Umezawaea endophytica]|uniref:LuxR C-terminal-related transcriptional regulator n=1 Tax=Umezawaea endophytica TaxID=1654476 RepID=A0A9X2VWT3_9PSEU|nr:LuxR C-terminal-related transcriptional regulator [Umezawaea endophytica]MCS7483128.1 LuxR C-terminal-related transcriptional regulator [Umezawaea endophytica]
MDVGVIDAVVADAGSACGEDRLGSSASDHLFRSLFDWSGLGIFCIDLDDRVVDANDDFLRVINRSADDVRGLALADFLHPAFLVNLRQRLATLVDGGRGQVIENIVLLRKGDGAVLGDLSLIPAGGRSEWSISMFAVFVPYDHTVDQLSVPGKKGLRFVGMGGRVLEGVAAGISTMQLATQLYLSRQGVEYHVGAMLRALDVPNRASLVSKAYELGILSVGVWPPRVAPSWRDDVAS